MANDRDVPAVRGDKALGPKCRRYKQSEARCAYLGSCCRRCTHWSNWTADGQPVCRDQACDEVTARRRARDRERYAARKATA